MTPIFCSIVYAEEVRQAEIQCQVDAHGTVIDLLA